MPSLHQPDDFPALNTMTPRAQRIALAYYERGHQDGWGRGWDAAEAEAAAIQRAAHAVAQQAAKTPTFADLCERRGQHTRATRQRAILTERGIA